MQVEVDSDTCIGVSTCIGLAPGAFRMGAQGVAQVRDPISDTTEAAIAEAVANCPVQAIRLVEG